MHPVAIKNCSHLPNASQLDFLLGQIARESILGNNIYKVASQSAQSNTCPMSMHLLYIARDKLSQQNIVSYAQK